ncbi:MAG: hypothetical protein K0Q72_191 [Armatimonadetes bacterium]|nr:hypothetical protein [Armatimonadota bacterium]
MIVILTLMVLALGPVSMAGFALAVTALVVWVRAWELRRVTALLALVDLVLVPLWVLGSTCGSLLLDERDTGIFSGPHGSLLLQAAIVAYVLSAGITAGLLCGKSAPDWMTPATGIWSRRLLALLAVAGFVLASTGELFWLAGAASVTDKLLAAGLAATVAAYLTPTWDVLVRGWILPGPAIPEEIAAHLETATRQPASGIAHPAATEKLQELRRLS